MDSDDETQNILKQPQLQVQQIEKYQNNIQNLDQLNFSKWHLYVITCLGITWFFDGYEVSLMSLFAQDIQKSFNINQGHIGFISSIYLIGAIIGSLFFGLVSSLYGRKNLFQITLIIYLISVIPIFFINSYQQFLILRFLTGVSVGGEYSAIFALVDEIIPKKSRGKVNIILDGTWHLGSIVSSLVLIFSQGTDYKWKLYFLIGGLAALPLIFFRKKIPESPRWLFLQQRNEEGHLVVCYIEHCIKNNYLWDEQIKTNNQYQNQSISSSFNQMLNNMGEAFDKYPQRFFLCLVLITSQAFFYQGIFYTFTMVLLQFYNVEKSESILKLFIAGYFMIIISLGSFLGTLIFGPFFDTIGRRKMISFTYIGSSLLLFTISKLFLYDVLNLYYSILCWFILFTLVTSGASAAHLTISEVFPSKIRSQIMGIFFAIGQTFGGVIAPTLFGYMISQNSRYEVSVLYDISSFMMLLGGITGYFYGVDAENRSLEEFNI